MFLCRYKHSFSWISATQRRCIACGVLEGGTFQQEVIPAKFRAPSRKKKTPLTEEQQERLAQAFDRIGKYVPPKKYGKADPRPDSREQLVTPLPIPTTVALEWFPLAWDEHPTAA